MPCGVGLGNLLQRNRRAQIDNKGFKRPLEPTTSRFRPRNVAKQQSSPPTPKFQVLMPSDETGSPLGIADQSLSKAEVMMTSQPAPKGGDTAPEGKNRKRGAGTCSILRFEPSYEPMPGLGRSLESVCPEISLKKAGRAHLAAVVTSQDRPGSTSTPCASMSAKAARPPARRSGCKDCRTARNTAPGCLSDASGYPRCNIIVHVPLHCVLGMQRLAMASRSRSPSSIPGRRGDRWSRFSPGGRATWQRQPGTVICRACPAAPIQRLPGRGRRVAPSSLLLTSHHKQ